MARRTTYHTLLGRLEKRLLLLEEGALLPSEQSLAEELQTSKPTLRIALAELAERGVIRKINGVGSVVTRRESTLSREIVFLCHDIRFFAETLEAFGIQCSGNNYFSSIVSLHGDTLSQERIIDTAAKRNPSGILIYADPRHLELNAYKRLAASGIPLVFLMRLPKSVKGSLVTFDNAEGITGLVGKLYRSGCRKIALYGDTDVNPLAAVERTNGYLQGLRKCRLRPKKKYICLTQKEADAFTTLFRKKETAPDAVCCLNDVCAGNLIARLAKDGIDLSEIRFTGFDNLPLAKFIPQPILTVNPPMHKLGMEAARMLFRSIENPAFRRPVCKKLPVEILRTKPFLKG